MNPEAHKLGPVFTTRKHGKPTIYFAFCACGHKSRSSRRGEIQEQHSGHLVATVPPRDTDRSSARWQRLRAALCEHSGLRESLDEYTDRVFDTLRTLTAPTAPPHQHARPGLTKGA